MSKLAKALLIIGFSLLLLSFLTANTAHIAQPPPSSIEAKLLANNAYILQNREAQSVYVYLELKAAKAPESKDKLPLNISLVLDRSGSMASERKLEYAKKAAEFVVENLSSKDHFSLVVYDDEVKTLSQSAKVSNKQPIKNRIELIEAGNTTNLSGGMLQGYHEVKTTFGEKAVNRVLLLSDGLANEGITDPKELQKIVQGRSTEQGISLSTFGVGADFNEDMMTNLAEYGSGNYYFIDNADKIPAIFAQELNGLLSVVAQNAQVEINYPTTYLKLAKLYGYPYSETQKGNIKVEFKDVFSEETKAVLLKFDVIQTPDEALNITSKITYDDALGDYSREVIDQEATFEITEDSTLYKEHVNELVAKNILLFEANEEMEKALAMVDEYNYDEAKDVLDNCIRKMTGSLSIIQADTSLNEQYMSIKNYRKQIDEIKEMNEQERKMMQKANKSSNYMLKKKKQ